MSKKKDLTPNQDTYKELSKKLRRRLSDLKKRGMTPNKAFKDEWVSTDIPDKPSKPLLKKMKNVLDDIYKYVRYYDPLKEVYISGKERRKHERSEATRKGWETRRENELKERYKDKPNAEELIRNAIQESELPSEEELILDYVKEMIENWQPSPLWSPELTELKREDRNLLKSVYDGAIASLGKKQVAKNIKGKTTELLQLVNDILYESGNKYKWTGREGIRIAIQRVRDILYGRASTVRESIELTELAEKLNEAE